MAYEYKFMTQEEQDEIIVTQYMAYERDKFQHDTNKARYEKMLEKLHPQVDLKQQRLRFKHGDIQMEDTDSHEVMVKKHWTNILNQTNSRIVEHDLILEELGKQLPSQERIDAAVKRINDRAAQARG